MAQKLKYLIWLNIVLLLIGYGAIKTFPENFIEDLHLDPIQTPTTTKPFYITAGDKRFYVEPLFDYELFGVIVSKHNSRQVILTYPDKNFNVTDLCVIWGDNVFSGAYKHLKFKNGDYFCMIDFKDDYAAKAYYNNAFDGFKNNKLSNNHILTDDPTLAKRLRDTRVGDQIYLKGYLVRYGTGPKNIMRSTSTSRDDTGDGACETIYVTSFTMLRHKTSAWYFLEAILGLSLIGLIITKYIHDRN